MEQLSDEDLVRRLEVGNELNKFCHFHQIKIPKVKIEFSLTQPQGRLRPDDHENWVWDTGIQLL